LLSFVTDDPTSVEVWKALVARDPDDLEAVTELARSTHVLQGPSAARAILERANPLTARLRNFNGAALTGLQPSTIVSLQCRYLVMERKLAEAERMCRQAIELGSQIIAHDNLARIALLRGDLDSANRASALAAKIGGAWQWSLRAVVMLLSNTDEKEFKLVLAHAMGDRGRPLAARLVYQRVKKSPAEWVEELESEEKQGWSTDLVKCGHFYVELGVPERSERCYQEARRIAPEAVSAAKALHLSESQPQQALTELEPVASGSKHPDVLAAMGVILHRLGRDREALDWLEHATARNPRLWQASAGISAACKRLQQPNCLMEAYERMHNRVLTP
jgi:tetratricopeptide (TPR) repeat protein